MKLPLGSRVQAVHNLPGHGIGHFGTVQEHSDQTGYAVKMNDSGALRQWFVDSELHPAGALDTGYKVGSNVELLLDWPRTAAITQVSDEVPHGVAMDGADEINWYMPSEMKLAEGPRAEPDHNKKLEGVVYLEKYNPDQPRVPGGEPGGGEWGSEGLPPVTDPAARGPAMLARVESYVAAGKDTESLYDKINGQRGRYTPEREAQQQQIVKEQLDKAIAAGAQKDGKAIMLGGIYGAGKTTTLNVLTDTSRYVNISPDTMKEELVSHGMVDPPPGVYPMEAASLIHEESSKMAWSLARAATAQGYNVIWDISMGSSGSVGARVESMKEVHSGYDITGVFVDVPVDQGIRSSNQRYANQLKRDPNYARFAPPAAIEATRDPTGRDNSKNRAAFEESKRLFNRWVLIDNTNFARRISAVSGPGVIVNGKLP